MKTANLFIAGQFDDALLYMGRLLVFTARRSLLVWDIDQLANQVTARLPQCGAMPTFMFARNDWFDTPATQRLLNDEATLRLLTAQMDAFPNVLEMKDASPLQQLDLPGVHGPLLDVGAYWRRLYVGTTVGLFHVDLEWESDRRLSPYDSEKRLEGRCLHISVGFGAVCASCGDDGLFFKTDEFGWLNRPAQEFRHYSVRSLRTEWLGANLVNYSSPTEFKFIGTNTENRRRVREQGNVLDERRVPEERRVIVFVEGPQELNYLTDLLGVRPDDIQFAYNSADRFFINTTSGEMIQLTLKRPRRKRLPKPAGVEHYEAAPAQVLSAHSTSVGVVFETESSVVLFSRGLWRPIITSPVLSVRTFQRSIRYRQLVATTMSEGVLLTGLFDDEPYWHPERKEAVES